MRKRMTWAASIVAFVLVASVTWAEANDAKVERDENAKQVAKAWFTSLIQGDTAITTSLSVVPFSFDGKQVKTLPELKKLYDQILAKRGKRELKPTSVKISSSSDEKVDVVIMIADEGIVVSVKPEEAFRVTGFRD